MLYKNLYLQNFTQPLRFFVILYWQWLRASTGFIQQTSKKKKKATKAAKRRQRKSDKLKVNRNKKEAEAYNLISKQNKFKIK